ncbi:MAG TPA: CoA-binding protein [Bacteroidota bacterium]
MPIEDPAAIESILRSSRTIALVGASENRFRDSNRIMQFLLDRGYRVYPVNPKYTSVLGEPCYPSLKAIPDHINIVDIFRRSDAVPAIADEAIAVKADTLWMQTGILHEEAARKAEKHGMKVLMDHCIAVEYSRLVR